MTKLLRLLINSVINSFGFVVLLAQQSTIWTLFLNGELRQDQILDAQAWSWLSLSIIFLPSMVFREWLKEKKILKENLDFDSKLDLIKKKILQESEGFDSKLDLIIGNQSLINQSIKEFKK